MSNAAALMIALVIDAALGWPAPLYRRIAHPVVWLGWLIQALEPRLNGPGRPRACRRAGGVLLLALALGLAAGTGRALTSLAPQGWGGLLLLSALAWPMLAARALQEHVAAVAAPLVAGDLAAARASVARIVGRDPNQLDEPGVARAAIESLAENTSDGVLAPLFWGVLLGLPGIFAYKAVNTLDSMVGHRNERYEAFGWASARCDDLANLLPARLTGLLFALAAWRLRSGIKAMWRDAPRHRSPNAGWPEAAMAAALGLRLSGPRVYGGQLNPEPYVNAAGREAMAADIGAALALYRRAMAMLALALLGLWVGGR